MFPYLYELPIPPFVHHGRMVSLNDIPLYGHIDKVTVKPHVGSLSIHPIKNSIPNALPDVGVPPCLYAAPLQLLRQHTRGLEGNLAEALLVIQPPIFTEKNIAKLNDSATHYWLNLQRRYSYAIEKSIDKRASFLSTSDNLTVPLQRFSPHYLLPPYHGLSIGDYSTGDLDKYLSSSQSTY